MPLFAIPENDLVFPHPSQALPDGLLGIGGDLNPERLMLAYRNGIFPWYGVDDPILWWSPPERCVLFPDKLHISKNMKQLLKRDTFQFTSNKAFEEVIRACSNTPRERQDGTWITDDMITAYVQLHHLGYAHSAEVWKNNALVGGLYGVRVGNIFCGESMFSHVTNASKTALILYVRFLQTQGVTLLDCQNYTPHLISLGAEMVNREEYLRLLSLSGQ